MYQLAQMNIETTKVSNTNESSQLSGIICYKQKFIDFLVSNDFNEEEIYTIMFVFEKMYPSIKGLSQKRQISIVFSACSIALNAGTESYNQINQHMSKCFDKFSIDCL